MTGGYLYDKKVCSSLINLGYNVDIKKVYTRYKGRGHSYIDALYSLLVSSSNANDIDIMDYTKSTCISKKNKGKRIIIFHHFDANENKKSKKYNRLFNNFLNNSKNSTVIVVSEYWKKYLIEQGVKNIKVIYNSFDAEQYKSFCAKDAFYQRFQLPNKPIIYIGKNSIAKTLKSYEKLRFLEKDYLIITTGLKQEFSGPLHLNLNLSEYKNLLYHSIVTLLFTNFTEGWSRIAHESILCGTPVIGNGSGGMKELLELSNQICMPQIEKTKLADIIDTLKENKSRINTAEIEKIASFNDNYFRSCWKTIIERIANN